MILGDLVGELQHHPGIGAVAVGQRQATLAKTFSRGPVVRHERVIPRRRRARPGIPDGLAVLLNVAPQSHAEPPAHLGMRHADLRVAPAALGEREEIGLVEQVGPVRDVPVVRVRGIRAAVLDAIAIFGLDLAPGVGKRVHPQADVEGLPLRPADLAPRESRLPAQRQVRRHLPDGSARHVLGLGVEEPHAAHAFEQFVDAVERPAGAPRSRSTGRRRPGCSIPPRPSRWHPSGASRPARSAPERYRGRRKTRTPRRSATRRPCRV